MDAMMDALRCDALALRGGRFSGALGSGLGRDRPTFPSAPGSWPHCAGELPACRQPCLGFQLPDLFFFFHPTGNFQVLASRCDAFSTPETTNSLKTHQHRLGLCEDESCLPSPLLKSFGNNPAQRGCTTGPGPGSSGPQRRPSSAVDSGSSTAANPDDSPAPPCHMK